MIVKSLGLVSPTTVPFTSVRLGKSTFQITTSVGRVLQTYDLRRGLNLIFLSHPQTPDIITATFAYKDKVFAAWGNLRPGSRGGIWVFKRGEKIASLDAPPAGHGPIEQLLVFGSWVVACTNSSVQVWKSETCEHYATLNPIVLPGQRGLAESIYTGKMCTMPTFLNKIFIGRYDGSVDIWNVRTAKLVYSLPAASSNAGPVTALEPTPVVSLVAIAHRSGAIFIKDVETGRTLLRLREESANIPPVTSVAFRSDDSGAGEDGHEPGVMATACPGSGDITLWDLNNGGKVTGIFRGAHSTTSEQARSGINRIEFLDGQPLLVSSGNDNSLQTWIFDESSLSPIPRRLHSRRGHSTPITTLTFLPAPSDGSEAGGKWLLSASKDCSLWGFSLRKDSQNTELSQGRGEHRADKSGVQRSAALDGYKAPEITCIACSLNRDGGMGVTASGPIWSNSRNPSAGANDSSGWESVVTGHRGDRFARTWFWGRKRAGRWAFETSDRTEVKVRSIFLIFQIPSS